MKIAIPTDDGINVAPLFDSAKGCMIITLVFGDIVHEDLRWRSGKPGSTPEEFCSSISDCSLVLVRDVNPAGIKVFQEKKITIARTADEIITNAIVHYLEHEHLEASNTCCCP